VVQIKCGPRNHRTDCKCPTCCHRGRL